MITVIICFLLDKMRNKKENKLNHFEALLIYIGLIQDIVLIIKLIK